MTTQFTTATEIAARFAEIRKTGKGDADTCRQLMAEGVNCADAAAAAWACAGKKAPHRDDYRAVAAWDTGYERSRYGR